MSARSPIGDIKNLGEGRRCVGVWRSRRCKGGAGEGRGGERGGRLGVRKKSGGRGDGARGGVEGGTYVPMGSYNLYYYHSYEHTRHALYTYKTHFVHIQDTPYIHTRHTLYTYKTHPVYIQDTPHSCESSTHHDDSNTEQIKKDHLALATACRNAS